MKTESSMPIVKPVWGEEKKLTIQVPRKESEEFKLYRIDDIQIGVGLNAQGNDQLRNKWAGKDDHWIHLDGFKSTHVILKLSGADALTPELLNLGASIVAYFSHFNDDWIPIIHTQVKNLKGVSGAAGMVIYKKEKHLRCPKVNIDYLIKD
jgi:predicted ribosome quality control (RQC) complex YloA/Tae2 family protein